MSKRDVLAAIVASVTLAMASGASAQATLMNGLGGEGGFGEGVLQYNDDGSSAEINITAAFPNGLPYFGQRFNSVYVNNNGTITFGGATGTYTPQRFPVSGNRMIAPFWADVDTRNGGRPARNGVYWDLSPGQMVITWHNVGYFSQSNDRENSFQLILTSNEILDQDDLWRVEFRYNRCEWTTGNASGGQGGMGGTPAQAGFDAGNGQIFEILPGSGTAGVLGLCGSSNVGVNGIWQFDIYLGTPQVGSGPQPQDDGTVETTDFSRTPRGRTTRSRPRARTRRRQR